MVSGALRKDWQSQEIAFRATSIEDVERIETLVDSTWPGYAVHGHPPESAEYLVDWPKLYELWPRFQFGLVDGQTGTMVACGNSLPLFWEGEASDLPDEGWDWAMHTGRVQHASHIRPNCLIPIAITVAKEYQGFGVSRRCLEVMRAIANEHGLSRIFAPVRPSRKSEHPNVPIDDYVEWRTLDGRIFDPWLRTHVSFGGKIIQPCRRSMYFQAPLAEWTRWTGRNHWCDGEQEAPTLLTPLTVDIQHDVGVYVEPNVWVEHFVRQ